MQTHTQMMKWLIGTAALAVGLMSVGVKAQNQNNVSVQCDPCYCWSRPSCPNGTFVYDYLYMYNHDEEETSVVCVGEKIYVQPWSTRTAPDPVIVHFSYGNANGSCPPGTITNVYDASAVEVITNWWVVSGPGTYSLASTNDPMYWDCEFRPTNCGSGTITFYTTWANHNPCSAFCDGYTNKCNFQTTSISSNFTVVNIQITPHSTNAVINKCLEPNRSVTFCLTNSCYPGGVTWTLDPDDVPDGATLSGSGDCATVKIGDVERSYTIWAVSNDNPDCKDSATLAVTRDCVCSNHVAGDYHLDDETPECPEGGTNYWPSQEIATTKCSGSIVASCATSGKRETVIQGGSSIEVAHCPYPRTTGYFKYWECGCDSVFKKTEFVVICCDTGDWRYGRGKRTTWMCPECQSPTNSCFTASPPPCPIWTSFSEIGRTCDGYDD